MPATAPPVAVLPGAEPVDLPGGPVGVLVCHGFTGTTQSVRPWAEHLHAAGLTVVAPRLPGHGTRWQDMNATGFDDWYGEVERSFDALRARCSTVFAMGLSMGGTLALRLAEQRADEVAGLVVVNASLGTDRRDARLAPLLSRVVPSFPGIASDIKKPGVRRARVRPGAAQGVRLAAGGLAGGRARPRSGSPARCSSTAAAPTGWSRR